MGYKRAEEDVGIFYGWQKKSLHSEKCFCNIPDCQYEGGRSSKGTVGILDSAELVLRFHIDSVDIPRRSIRERLSDKGLRQVGPQ